MDLSIIFHRVITPDFSVTITGTAPICRALVGSTVKVCGNKNPL
jgi:hypothetical protein